MALGGWSRSGMIDMVDRRTDRRGSKKLDLDAEFLAALQEFCLEHKWPWRRKSGKFILEVDTSIYDMSEMESEDGDDLMHFHVFQENGVHLLLADGSKSEINPVFDTVEQDELLDDASTSGPPKVYFVQPTMVLNFHPAPDQEYPVRMSWWTVPSGTPGEQDDEIPLVPGHLHHVLAKKFELQILRFTLGEGSSKYQAVSAEYQKLVQGYQLYEEFSGGKITEYRDNSPSNYVQST